MWSELAGNKEQQHNQRADNKSFLYASKVKISQLTEALFFKRSNMTSAVH